MPLNGAIESNGNIKTKALGSVRMKYPAATASAGTLRQSDSLPQQEAVAQI